MKTRLFLLALYSPHYPAIGETHGVSTVAGAVEVGLAGTPIEFMLVDMVALAGNREEVALKKITEFKPDIVGISLTYGSFNVLKQIYPEIRKGMNGVGQVIFGGVLATYIPEVLLSEVDSGALVVCGEGEEAMEALVRALIVKTPLDSVPNLTRRTEEGGICINPRRLVDLNRLAPPYRAHVNELVECGAQIFVEASRGCSWAACTFCLRGLTDIKGKGTEYRRFPLARLQADLNALYDRGVRSVTFADEDFLGGLGKDMYQFVDDFSRVMKNFPGLSFDLSLTVRSVFDHKWSEAEVRERARQIERLRCIGLRKAFLGIESASLPQLKRYSKGHTAFEALNACRQILQSGALLELGFIMFDPLCDIHDILCNIDFLTGNDLVQYVSFFCNEMRLQVGSRYRAALEKHESESGRLLFSRVLDYNTLTFETNYSDERVSHLVGVVRNWNTDFRNLHYPLKTLSRYGDGGSLGTVRGAVLDLVKSMRTQFMEIFRAAASDCATGGEVSDGSELLFESAMQGWAREVLAVFEKSKGSYVSSEIIDKLLRQAATIAGRGQIGLIDRRG